ncbi:MAG: hypothetical protein AAFY72_01390, partial [Cyanobacteria bacterium J06649_4]
VMPFVHLKPGQWDLKCSSVNVIDDFMGDGWQYSVQLQVFAHTDEDWSDEWPVPSDGDTASTSLVEVEDAPVNADLPLVQAQAQLKEHQQNTTQLQGVIAESGEPASGDSSAESDAAYRIYLQQQAFLAQPNQPMTITGQVQALLSLSPAESASQLWLRLQNPETAQVIMEAHRPLSLARLPADFKVKIQLPSNVKTRVVLGEVSLRTPETALDGPARVLSSTAFTITAGIAQLLDDLANQEVGAFEEEVSVYSAAGESSKNSSSVSAEVAAVAVPSLNPTHKPVAPAVGVVLPPQLDRPLSEDSSYGIAAKTAEQPELPTFQNGNAVAESNGLNSNGSQAAIDSRMNEGNGTGPLIVSDGPGDLEPMPEPMANSQGTVSSQMGSQVSSRAPMVSQPAQFMGTSIEDDDLETDQIAALLEDIDSDLGADASDVSTLEPPGVEGILPLPKPKTPDEHPAPIPPATTPSGKPNNQFHRKNTRHQEANLAFKSLKLKDHFWNRLSNLTHESHKEASELAANMKAAGVSPQQSVSNPLTPLTPQDLQENSEVVIYDDPAPAPQRPAERLRNQTRRLPSNSAQPATPQGSTNQGLSAQGVPPQNSTSDIPVPPVPTQSAVPQSVASQSLPSQPFPTQSARSLSNSSLSSNSLPSSPAIPPEDLPEMALPVITVPIGDLVAGSTITVIVRTRPSPYKPFIKLWMVDRQSRTLVGEPQLLTNLRPDALGDLETSAEMRVPMGCLDVQIAAIAVDMATQQESNKAIVNRHVIPANQPSTSPRGFNF